MATTKIPPDVPPPALWAGLREGPREADPARCLGLARRSHEVRPRPRRLPLHQGDAVNRSIISIGQAVGLRQVDLRPSSFSSFFSVALLIVCRTLSYPF